MSRLQLIANLISDDTEIDALIDEIDFAARECSSYDYGLPLHDPYREVFRKIILRWVFRLPDLE